MIIGASKIAYYLAEALVNNKYNVKIIEVNQDKAKAIAESIKGANVVLGDGANQEVLSEEGLQNYDAVVCLTGIDEENIIISLYANKLNIRKTITKVNKASFAGLLESIEMGSVIYPQEIAANQVVSYIRSNANRRGNNIVTLHKIVNNQVEAVELIVSKESSLLNKPLKDLKLKENILIGGIIRNQEVIIPSGTTTINENDSVIVVSKGIIINDLGDILA